MEAAIKGARDSIRTKLNHEKMLRNAEVGTIMTETDSTWT